MTNIEEQSMALILETFDTLSNHIAAAERFGSEFYIQDSAHVPPGRDGLFGVVRSAPLETRYEDALIVANRDCVMSGGRF